MPGVKKLPAKNFQVSCELFDSFFMIRPPLELLPVLGPGSCDNIEADRKQTIYRQKTDIFIEPSGR